MTDPVFVVSIHAIPGSNEAHELANLLGAEIREIGAKADPQDHLIVLCLDGIELNDQPRVVRDLCEQFGKEQRKVICVRSASGSAWPLLGAGANDVVSGPKNERIEGIRDCIAHWRAVKLAMDNARSRLVGSSRIWLAAIQNVVEAALFCRHPVLITGANGTGKELAAHLIHQLDPRASKGELVLLDCSTISPELSGSEFFGHERGAFTSAIATRDGAFAQANRGTLFLDEVGELPVRLQAELLRAIQEKSFKRVGGSIWTHVDFRLVAATNRDLSRERSDGGFREDFYHRIASWKCHLPSLGERRDDIVPLALHFLSKEKPGTEPRLSTDVVDFLLGRDYPGNTRELAQLIRRMAVRWNGKSPMGAGCIPFEERPDLRSFAVPFFMTTSSARTADEAAATPLEDAVSRLLSEGIGLGEIKEKASDIAYRIALEREEWNIQKAAKSLQVSDRSVQLYVKSTKEGGDN